MKPWIGFDLDGTLARYESGQDLNTIGEPIDSMVQRLRAHLDDGYDVRIVTARVAACGDINDAGIADDVAFAKDQRQRISAWLIKHVGRDLPVTASKDFGMVLLYDDRAIEVVTNTGELYRTKSSNPSGDTSHGMDRRNAEESNSGAEA